MKTTCDCPDIINMGAQSKINQFALQPLTKLYEILWFDVSMHDILVLKVGEEFDEVIGEIDDFLNRKVLISIFNNILEWGVSKFHNDSDL